MKIISLYSQSTIIGKRQFNNSSLLNKITINPKTTSSKITTTSSKQITISSSSSHIKSQLLLLFKKRKSSVTQTLWVVVKRKSLLSPWPKSKLRTTSKYSQFSCEISQNRRTGSSNKDNKTLIKLQSKIIHTNNSNSNNRTITPSSSSNNKTTPTRTTTKTKTTIASNPLRTSSRPRSPPMLPWV